MGTDRLTPYTPPPPPPPKPEPPKPAPPARASKASEPAQAPARAGDSATGLVERARGNTGALQEPTFGAAALPGKYRSPLFGPSTPPATPDAPSRAAVTLPEAKASTGEVEEQLDNATKDDDETAEDLREAADAARTPEDLAAIMEVAKNEGQDPEAVLRQTLKARDEGAERPNQTMYDAVADQYEALGKPEMATAVRAAGNPDISKDVRHDLTQALQDGDETTEDLQDAAKNARSARDVEAVLQAQAATGAGDKHDILQHVLLGQDENAESPNSEVFEAVAQAWEAMGDNQRAIAARAAGDPAVDAHVREKLVHALQDEKDTAEDIEEAFEIVEWLKEQPVQVDPSTGMPLNQPWAAADDYKAAFETGKATIGEAHTKQLDAEVQLDDKVEAFEDKQQDVEKLDARLAGMLGRTEGALDAEGQAKLVADFKEKHGQAYGALEAAREDLAKVVADNQDALADALSSPEARDEVDVEVLEKALAASASSQAGEAAVEHIATEMLKNADALPKEREKLLTEKVMPIVMERAMQRALVASEGDAKAAVDKFENTPFGQAVKGLGTAATSVASLKQFSTGYQGLTTALREGRARELGTVIEEQAALSQSNRLSGSLAGLGLALGAVQFGNAEGFSEHAQAALSVAGSGGDLIQSFSGTMAALQQGGKAANALAKGVPVINAVAGTLGAAKSFQDGDLVGGGLNLAGAGLALAALAGVPGANVAAAVVAVGAIAWSAWKAHDEKNQMQDELTDLLKDQDVEGGLRRYLVENDPGAYKETKEKLGFSDAQLQALVAGDSKLHRSLGRIADSQPLRDFHESKAKAAGLPFYDYLLTLR